MPRNSRTSIRASLAVISLRASPGEGGFPRSLSKSEAELGQKLPRPRGSCRPESTCPSGAGSDCSLLPPKVHGPQRCVLSLLQVNLVLGDGRSLGLTIRGGAEYGLGIYVTGVDPGSEAESSGLKVRGPDSHPRGWGAGLQAWGREGPPEPRGELLEADCGQTCSSAVSIHLRDWPPAAWLSFTGQSQRQGLCSLFKARVPHCPRHRVPPTRCWAPGQPGSLWLLFCKPC